jgi:trypsin
MRRRLIGILAAIVAVLGLVPVAGAAQSGANTSVINGQEAPVGGFPYMAFVVFSNGAEADLCSGTVVSSNVVLTAAHCVLSESFSVLRNPANLTVVTGNVDWASPARTVSAAIRAAVDPDFAWSVPGLSPIRGDAAVVELAAPITAPPIDLATAQTWNTGTGAVMAGWGRVTAGGTFVETLRIGEAVIQAPEYCRGKSSHFESAWFLCAQDYPNARYSTCNGDSGGPLLTAGPSGEPLEIGVTSYGVGEECSPGLPQYYTRADSIAPWVAQKVAEWAPSLPTGPTTPTTPAPKATPAPAPAAPTLPVMPRGRAVTYATSTLRLRLWPQFRRHGGLRISCTSTATPRQRCNVGWSQGRKSYWGTVDVFYLFESGRLSWGDKYRVQTITECDPRCLRRTFTG